MHLPPVNTKLQVRKRKGKQPLTLAHNGTSVTIKDAFGRLKHRFLVTDQVELVKYKVYK